MTLFLVIGNNQFVFSTIRTSKIQIMELLNNSGTEIYRKLAFQLKEEGVTEEEYIKMLDRKLPNWQKDEDMKNRIEAVLDILFHTFF